MKKLFIIRKYVWAKNAKDAIEQDKETPVDDVWVDDDWKKGSSERQPMGFHKPKG